MLPDRWLVHVADMRAAIRAIRRYTSDVTREEFFANNMLFDSVIRQFIVLGEAASRVSVDIQEKHPDIPWDEMRRLRNFVVHQYDEINRQTIWDTIHKDLPSLNLQIGNLLDNE